MASPLVIGDWRGQVLFVKGFVDGDFAGAAADSGLFMVSMRQAIHFIFSAVCLHWVTVVGLAGTKKYKKRQYMQRTICIPACPNAGAGHEKSMHSANTTAPSTCPFFPSNIFGDGFAQTGRQGWLVSFLSCLKFSATFSTT
jgi:hypothetical protein